MASARKKLEKRVEELESELSAQKKSTGKTKIHVDRWQQTLTWVVEGTQALEDLHTQHVSTPESPEWLAFKEAVPGKLMEELAEQVGVIWPLASGDPDPNELGDKLDLAVALGIMHKALTHGGIANLNPQKRKTGERVPNVFRMVLPPGLYSWEFQRAVTDVLDKELILDALRIPTSSVFPVFSNVLSTQACLGKTTTPLNHLSPTFLTRS